LRFHFDAELCSTPPEYTPGSVIVVNKHQVKEY